MEGASAARGTRGNRGRPGRALEPASMRDGGEPCPYGSQDTHDGTTGRPGRL
ncbi:hypothetical protein STXM2123_1771 [Streptomyces sp. F-3]|nr:hypothetical protein STXM2123_1771 [Streptomyces sp. F-3]